MFKKVLAGVLALVVTLIVPVTALASWGTKDAMAPAPVTTEVHVLDWGDDLPMFNGDLDTILFEVVNGSEYTAWCSGTPTSAPWVHEMDSDFQVVMDALGGELFALDHVQDTHVDSGSTLFPWSSGTVHYLLDPTTSRTITSDTRCDNFEGTGTVSISWAAKGGTTIGYTTGSGTNQGGHNMTQVSVRVTYTSK